MAIDMRTVRDVQILGNMPFQNLNIPKFRYLRKFVEQNTPKIGVYVGILASKYNDVFSGAEAPNSQMANASPSLRFALQAESEDTLLSYLVRLIIVSFRALKMT